MTTVRDLIQSARRKIGTLAAGESMTAEEGVDHLQTLNAMLATWNTQELLVYTLNRQTFALVAGQQQYTLGAGGDFNVVRPFNIEYASILLNASTAPQEIPLEIYTEDGWREVVMKSVVSSWPTGVYIQNDLPLNHLQFWPVPTAPCSVILGTWQRTVAFTNLSDDVVFPDGYDRAIIYNLAVELAPEFEREASATVQRVASESLRLISDANWEPAFSDPGFGDSGGYSLQTIRSRGLYMP
jgi:hypothetical protein